MDMNSIQQEVQDSRRRAASWAKSLKFKEAALDLLALLLLVPGYIVGFLWFAIKYLVGLLVEGFKMGARSDRT